MPFDVTSNIGRVMKAYVDDFKIGHAAGIIGETVFQNPIDAAVRGNLSKVRVNLFIHREARILKIRDRGTKGLDHCSECEWGRVKDEETGQVTQTQCQNYSQCDWSVFFSLAQEGKGLGELGSRGLGKSLCALAGSEGIIVRTKIATEGSKHKSMAAYFRPKSSVEGGWEWDTLPDEAWNWKEDPGTEIEVKGLNKDLIKDFSNPQKIVDEYVLPYWFPSIDQGVEVTLRITGQKKIKIDKSMTENLFPEVPANKRTHYQSLKIKVGRKEVGKINDLHLHLADQPLPEHLQGVALIKGDRQVIMRIKNFGYNIDQLLQQRLFGWVHTGRLLDSYETPNHLDYNDSNATVRKTFDQIKGTTKTFLEPFDKELKTESVSAKDVDRASKIKEAMNKAFEDVPDFNPWSEGPDPGPDPGPDNPDKKCNKCGKKPCTCEKPPPKEWDHPWISSIVFDPSGTEPFSIGDDITARVTISNPLDREPPYLSLRWGAANASYEWVEEGSLTTEEFGIIPRPTSKDEPGQIVHEFTFNIHTGEGAFRKGKNWLQVEIAEETPGSEENRVSFVHKRKRAFWVETKPPPKGSSGSSIINAVQPIHSESGGKDVFLDFQDQDVYAFTKSGPNIAPYWGKSRHHAIAVRNLFQAAGDEIVNHIVREKLSTIGGELTIGSVVGDEGILPEVILAKIKWVAAAQKAAFE